MAVNLLENYGVVPQAIYPESLHSEMTGPVNKLLMTKLREHAVILRKLSVSLRSQFFSEICVLSALRAKKEELLKEIYTIMSAVFGPPPPPTSEFEWDYYDSDGKACKYTGTPREFYKAFLGKYTPDESFSLINDPRNAYDALYTVDKLGNVWGGRPVLYVNTEIEGLKKAVVDQIKAGRAVFFGCDVGKFSDKAKGIMDTALFDYEVSASLTFYFCLALMLRGSCRTHSISP